MKYESYSISIGVIVVGVSILLLAHKFIFEFIGAFIEGIGVWLFVDTNMRVNLNKSINKVIRFFQGKKAWE